MQINHPEWRSHPWLFRLIRRVSVPLTWLLLRTPLNPNEISLAGIFSGVLAAVLMASGHWYSGVLIMFLAILLDFSDGEVSRSRRMQSKEGSYLDKVYIFCVHPALMAGMSIGAYLASGSVAVLAAGFIGTISIVLLCVVTEYAKQIVVWKHCQRLLEALRDPAAGPQPPLLPELTECVAEHVSADAQELEPSGWMAMLRTVYSAWDFPWIFVIMAIAIVSQAFFWPRGDSDAIRPMALFLYFYAITYPVWILIFLIRNVYSKNVDAQYRQAERLILQLIRVQMNR